MASKREISTQVACEGLQLKCSGPLENSPFYYCRALLSLLFTLKWFPEPDRKDGDRADWEAAEPVALQGKLVVLGEVMLETEPTAVVLPLAIAVVKQPL